MTHLLTNVVSFAFALGVIIFVHESGHLLVAKAFGVKVLTFSLGFGKSLWSVTRGETEYRISALPLGGYVRLSGENAEETTGDPRDFQSKPRWQRILVYLAGPAMNVVLAIVLFAVLFMVGIAVPNIIAIPAVVGAVEPGSSAAAAGIVRGDRILTVKGKPVANWEDLGFELLASPDRPVPLVAAGLAWVLSPGTSVVPAPPTLLTPSLALLAACLLASVGLGTLVLFARVPLPETIASLGILGFGTPYFALPIASLSLLQRIDPWLVFLLMAIVWLGDTAAYYAGSRLGRHRMAPTISPKKSWEGAAAGFVTSVVAAAVWSSWRLGRITPGLLALAALTAVAAQVGDLVESMVKRGSGVKDSGRVLPGHGGVLDRIDSILFPPILVYLYLMLFHLL